MNVTVNSQALSLLIKDLKSNDDVIEFLNLVIDEEIEKEIPDCDLIAECVQAIASLEDSDSKAPVLHIALTPETVKKIVNPHRSSWKNLNKALRVAIIAAIIATGSISVNAAVKSVTGVNLFKEIATAVAEVFSPSEENSGNKIQVAKRPTPELNEQVNSSTDEPNPKEKVTENTETTSSKSENTIKSAVEQAEPTSSISSKKPEVKTDDKPLITQPSISYAPSVDDGKDPEKNNSGSSSAPSKTFKGVEAQYAAMNRNLVVGEVLDYTGMTVYAVYSDGSKEQVSLDECTYQKAFDTATVGDYTLSVKYKSAVFTFGVTVRPDEETRYSSICSNDDYDYLLADKGAYIVKYKGQNDKLKLDSVDGNSVYALTSNLFASSDIKEFESASVAKLYDGIFKNCKSLKKVNLPKCSYIGANAFNGCENLTDFNLADILISIGESSFAKSGIDEITLGSKITSVPDFAFAECQSLTEVNMLGKVTEIGNNAFSECTSLLSVNGTAYISTVGDFGFYSCEFMEFDSQPLRFHSVGNCGFAYCKTVDLGELYGLSSIGAQAFQYCINIDSVCILNNVKTVPNAAFQGAHIKELTIEDGVEVIEPYAFMGTLITKLELPSTVTNIGTYAFYTSALRTVNGGSNVKFVGSLAFYPSKRLTIYAEEENALTRYAEENNIKYSVGNTADEQ